MTNYIITEYDNNRNEIIMKHSYINKKRAAYK